MVSTVLPAGRYPDGMRLFSVVVRAACMLVALSPGVAHAQAQGTYPATLACDAEGMFSRRERTEFELRLEGGQARYLIRIAGRGQEMGTGVLTGGRLSLTGSMTGTGGYTARYSGEVGGRGGVLRGTQSPTGGGKPRACQIILGDG